MGLIKDQMVLEYKPLIKLVAHKIAARLPSSVEIDDLISAGTLGLLDAIAKYNPERKNLFKTYAEFRIRGAMLDELRSQDWVPRSVRDKQKVLEKTIGHIQNITDVEAAVEMGFSLEDYRKFLNQVRSVGYIELDAENCNVQLIDPKDHHKAFEAKRDSDRLMMGLPQRQKIAMKLYYVWGLTMIEISELFEITESRVCQLIQQAEMNLKKKTSPESGTPATPPPLPYNLPNHDFDKGA